MRKYNISKRDFSPTLDAVLGYIYRKQELLQRCGRYAKVVIDGLCKLEFLKEVHTKKGTFYFSTEKAKNFKAKDFAREFLLAFHNPQYKDGNKILVFDSQFPDGKALMEVEEAIRKGIV